MGGNRSGVVDDGYSYSPSHHLEAQITNISRNLYSSSDNRFPIWYWPAFSCGDKWRFWRCWRVGELSVCVWPVSALQFINYYDWPDHSPRGPSHHAPPPNNSNDNPHNFFVANYFSGFGNNFNHDEIRKRLLFLKTFNLNSLIIFSTLKRLWVLIN